MPVLPSPADAPGAALHRDGDDRRGHPRRPRRGCSASTRRSIRWRCSSAAPIPRDLAAAARIGADFGYDEINLNVGCPSDRVQDGRFGACLMREPALVGDCVAAMKARGRRCRSRSSAASASTSRTPEAALDAPRRRGASRPAPTRSSCMPARPGSKGLSPKENRDIPPLDYAPRLPAEGARVPALPIVINGGIDDARGGRGAPRTRRRRDARPRRLSRARSCCSRVDPELFGEAAPVADAFAAVEAFEPYVAARLAEGARLLR